MKISHRLRRALVWTLMLGAVGFVALSAVTAWLLTSGRNHSVGLVPTDFGWSVEAVRFQARADAVGLSGWFVPCPGAKAAVVLLHGYQADRRMMISRARWLRELGFAVLLYDARACGESEGDKISAGWYETRDLLGALDFLRGRGFASFGCLGISQGGATIALASAQLDGVRWAVLESTYPTMHNALDRRFRLKVGLPVWLAGLLVVPFAEWRLGVDADKVSPRDEAVSFRFPVFVLSGERDTRTKPDDARAVFEHIATPKEFWVVHGADHEDLMEVAPVEYRQRINAFIEIFK
jgi:pimeloyl-ACP methyl ester carboxylesterase